MDTAISIISDLIVLVFDLTLYMKLTLLKKDDALHRGIMYAGTCIITVAYIIFAYVLGVPYAISTFVCMSVPSFLLFITLSKYKSARFLVTFCFVDTVTFVIAAFGKFALLLGGQYGGILSCLVLLALSILTSILVYPYCPRYRELMDQVSKGWGPMAVSTVLIYLLLIFSTAYPEAMVNRLEYLPVFVLQCITILSFYAVFIVLIIQKAKLSRANILLQQQQHWQQLAYSDELTQLGNQAAYDARTAEIAAQETHRDPCAVMIFDIDNFKHINDTYGHHFGNTVLKNTADFFLHTFPVQYYEFFRVGGDEFAALVTGLHKNQIQEHVNRINAMKQSQYPGCTYSCGFSLVDFSLENPFEQAFIQADKAMYSVKTGKKNNGR